MIPYDKRSGKIWYNGELVDWTDVKVHVLSHGLHYASCVFEGERVYDGSIFKLEEHTSRLFYSAKRMGFEIPYSEEEINAASNKIISTPIFGVLTLNCLANSNKTATPLPPSFAPKMGLLVFLVS